MSLRGTLGRFVRPRAAAAPEPRCEICAAPAPEPHPHLVDLERRTIRCACTACAVLFRAPQARARFRTVPERVLFEPGFELADGEWEALQIPVRLAFLLQSSAAGRWVAVYPGPAGVVESALPLDGWARVAARSALAAAATPDVEALFVRGDRAPRGAGSPRAPLEVLLVPVDRCYALAGRLRRSWRGLDGGAEARRELDAFFAELRARARPLAPLRGGPR